MCVNLVVKIINTKGTVRIVSGMVIVTVSLNEISYDATGCNVMVSVSSVVIAVETATDPTTTAVARLCCHPLLQGEPGPGNPELRLVIMSALFATFHESWVTVRIIVSVPVTIMAEGKKR